MKKTLYKDRLKQRYVREGSKHLHLAETTSDQHERYRQLHLALSYLFRHIPQNTYYPKAERTRFRFIREVHSDDTAAEEAKKEFLDSLDYNLRCYKYGLIQKIH